MAYAAQQPLIWHKTTPPAPARLPISARLWHELRLAAQFGAFAAGNDDVQALLDEACRVAAEGLGTGLAKFLVHLPEERAFVLQAGVGWRAGIVGQARLPVDALTTASLAWFSGQPVLCNDLVADGWFGLPAVLTGHGIIRSVNVVVPGDGGAFGILEVGSAERGEFAGHDLCFLQLLAHSLSEAIRRGERQARHETHEARSDDHHRTAMCEMQHRVRNDLQTIGRLVSLEARRATQASQRVGLDRVNRHVMALAELYDHLLGTRMVGFVEMGAYLSALCGKIADAADLSSRAIELSADTEPLVLPLSRAVQIAIAVNELVANAAEHAFPRQRPGRITVRLLAKGESGQPLVTVADDGCGFGGTRPDGKGLSFAKHLVQQAGGVLAREHGAGTRWRMEIAS